jgi:L-histidine Nalpha-methyltransferase
MGEAYVVLDQGLPQGDERKAFALDVLTGLSERPRRLPSKYLYDDEGSRLFRAIMRLPTYYPTQREQAIIEAHTQAIIAPMHGEAFDLVDLGAGDGTKTMVLLKALAEAQADVRYVPIDISIEAMRGVTARALREVPTLHTEGLVANYLDGIQWLSEKYPERSRLVLFLGSNIGNFHKPEARKFLRTIWSVLSPDDRLLIGFDLKKDIERLLAAYNDPTGTTAAFNLNLLTRINRELGGDFDLQKWQHFGTYNVFSGGMESYLVSREDQTVSLEALELRFAFEPWEPVQTEYSYKYLERDIDALAAATGFGIQDRFYDLERDFLDALWRVEKNLRSGPSRRA